MNYSPSDLEKLRKLQGEESGNKRKEDLFDLYRDWLKQSGIKNYATYPVKWGLLSRKELRTGDDGNVIFSIETATKIPHLIFEIIFNGNVKTDRGGVSQKFKISPYRIMVTDGWEEWFSTVQKRLPKTNQILPPPAQSNKSMLTGNNSS